jgi:hypothetical protein
MVCIIQYFEPKLCLKPNHPIWSISFPTTKIMRIPYSPKLIFPVKNRQIQATLSRLPQQWLNILWKCHEIKLSLSSPIYNNCERKTSTFSKSTRLFQLYYHSACIRDQMMTANLRLNKRIGLILLNVKWYIFCVTIDDPAIFDLPIF